MHPDRRREGRAIRKQRRQFRQLTVSMTSLSMAMSAFVQSVGHNFSLLNDFALLAELDRLDVSLIAVGASEHALAEVARREAVIAANAQSQPRAFVHPGIAARRSVLRDVMEGHLS